MLLLGENLSDMKPACTLLTAVGIVTALAAEYTATQIGWREDIRTEWFCWAALSLVLWVERYVTKRHLVADDKTLECETPSAILNQMIWAASFCIAVARIIPLYYDVVSVLVGDPARN
jgi:hypothetical protein